MKSNRNFYSEWTDALERHDYDEEHPEVMKARIAYLENEVEELTDLYETAVASMGDGENDAYESEPKRGWEDSRRPGLGLRIRAGEEPKLYRTSNPNGSLIPEGKFAGFDFEVNPGHGFSIKPKFKPRSE